MSATLVRRGDWTQTFSGRAFFPLDPRPEEVCIEDIAHALSNLCRFGGACRWYYSVAEHSFAVSRIVSPEAARAGLLHDAAEAYLCDLPRPIKQFLPDYQAAEQLIHAAICERFGIEEGHAAEIRTADDRMLHTEMLAMMRRAPAPWRAGMPDPIPDFSFAHYGPVQAEAVFLQRWEELR